MVCEQIYYISGRAEGSPAHRGQNMGYTKNVAVIKGIQGGFSADGGELSGLVKCESYSGKLRCEVSLINFAPLTEGRYVAAIGDGKNAQIVENGLFEGASAVDTSAGFAACVCYVNGVVQPVATAACGNFAHAVAALKESIERAENTPASPPEKKEVKAAPVNGYDDEAIAAENYYEIHNADEGGEPVREDKKEEADGDKPREDEAGAFSFQEGNFYKRMENEIERVLNGYPPCAELCQKTEDSRWVEIDYGGGAFYVFGVIYSGGNPKYLCYGIPASSAAPPASMQGLAEYIGVKTRHGDGFWVMYQSAETGKQILPQK